MRKSSSAKSQAFLTHDLGCAAALTSTGFELVALNKENPQKVQFVFSGTRNIEAVASEYWADKLPVKARTLFDNIKMLKNRIYSK